MELDEEVGESIGLKDREVVTIRKDLNANSTKWGAEDLGVKFIAKNSTKGKKWAEGYGDREKMGEHIDLRDHDVVTILPPGKVNPDPKSNDHGSTPLRVNYHAKNATKLGNLKKTKP